MLLTWVKYNADKYNIGIHQGFLPPPESKDEKICLSTGLEQQLTERNAGTAKLSAAHIGSTSVPQRKSWVSWKAHDMAHDAFQASA